MAEHTLILTSGNTINFGWFNAGKKHTDAKVDIVKNFNAPKNKDVFTEAECSSWLKNKTQNPKNGKKNKREWSNL